MDRIATENFRILAVDDEELILQLYKKILESRRHCGDEALMAPRFEVSLCRRGDKAVDLVRNAARDKEPFNVVFLDINMPPGPDGLWTGERIRKCDPDVGIVIVTGRHDFMPAKTAKQIPPVDKLLFLQKPFHEHEIRQFANALCAKWKVENDLRSIRAGLEDLVETRTAELNESNARLKREIQERVRAEEKLRLIISSNADAIIILDRHGVVRFANPAAGKLFGRETSEFLGHSFGFPLLAGEKTDLEIFRRPGNVGSAEMQLVEIEWEGKRAYLASLRDTTERRRMECQVKKSLEDVRRAMKGTIAAMALTVETRDPYTAGHQQRVANLARAIAREMGLPEKQIEGLYMAGVIHDLGKLSVPTDILSKPTRLSSLEFSLIKTHPRAGYEIVKDIEFPWPVATIMLQHHEKIDGSGYPQGLSGEEILIESRILTIADVVEAMASDRPYRPALGMEVALEEISSKKGKLYDREASEACLKIILEDGYDLNQ